MYIAMNRFPVVEGKEEVFETAWRNRDRYLHEVEGILDFKLLRGDTADGETPYVSHSAWASKEDFMSWTRSDAFRKAHANARSPAGTFAGPPSFSGWVVVLED